MSQTGLSGGVHKTLRSSLATYAHTAAGLYPRGSLIVRFWLCATTTYCTGEAVILGPYRELHLGNGTQTRLELCAPRVHVANRLSVPKEDY
jgi:hypothetical protein